MGPTCQVMARLSVYTDEKVYVYDFSAFCIQAERRTRNKTVALWQSGLSSGKLREHVDQHVISAVGGQWGGESRGKLEEDPRLGFRVEWEFTRVMKAHGVAGVGAEQHG